QGNDVSWSHTRGSQRVCELIGLLIELRTSKRGHAEELVVVTDHGCRGGTFHKLRFDQFLKGGVIREGRLCTVEFSDALEIGFAGGTLGRRFHINMLTEGSL
ncbi:MAG: hypothetical protein ACXWMV_06560, partial [Syntrophales bacterium]